MKTRKNRDMLLEFRRELGEDSGKLFLFPIRLAGKSEKGYPDLSYTHSVIGNDWNYCFSLFRSSDSFDVIVTKPLFSRTRHRCVTRYARKLFLATVLAKELYAKDVRPSLSLSRSDGAFSACSCRLRRQTSEMLG